jgi:transglutaminase-like putative cysteine protease
MKTSQVIGAGTARYPDRVSGTVAPGSSPGTWVAPGELGPGDTYSVTVYSPHPSAAQLKVAGTHYPAELLPWYLSLQIPVGHQAARPLPVNFPPFHRRTAEIGGIEASTAEDTALLKQSPYAPAFALARRLATQSRTPYDYATRIEAYLGNGYVYDEKPPVRLYPLESFLFDDKLGYCQQFAGTMALLLRMGGVPARVATGFATGVYDAKAHRWTATDVDAHSWVEAWFPHYGWVRFDPTPYAAPARGGQAPSSAASALSFDTSQTAAGQGHRDAPVPSPKKASAGKSGGASSTIVLGALGGVALLVILGLLVAGTRAQPDPERLLAELERALARSGRPLSPNVTLAALEQRFRHAPEAAAYVKALRLARYGGAGELPSARQRRAVRAQLRAGLGLTGLLRSLWALPPRRTARTASDGHTRGINSE